MISIHTHVETPTTASPMADFIAKAKALGRTHMSYTDVGQMTGLYKFYKQVNEAKMKFIPGVEIYFRDAKELPATLYPRAGYFTITLYPTTQESFFELCRLSNKVRPKFTDKIDNEIPLYGWEDFEALKGKGIEAVLSGPHSMAAKALLAGKKIDDIRPMIERLKSIFNLSVALIGADQSAYYRTVMKITTNKGELELYRNDKIDTIKQGKVVKQIPAFDIERGGHFKLIGLTRGGVYNKASLDIKGFRFEDKFMPLKMGNVMAKANKAHLALAQMFDLQVLSSDYAFMASPEDKKVQDIRMEGSALQPVFHMQSEAEYVQAITNQGIPAEKAQAAVEATKQWATKFDNFSLKYGWRLPKVTDEPNKYMLELIKKTGRMKWQDPVWVERIKMELDVISRNGVYDLLPYFFPIAMVFDHYKQNGRLTGPSRGSVGGSLLAYVMGFTHLNPLEYDLPFERFFSMDRIKNKKLPDVDVDLPDRELLVGDGDKGFLHEKFGYMAGQVSTRGMIRLKSAIKDVNRIFNKGLVEPEIEKFSESLPAPPQGVNDKDFVFGFIDKKTGERMRDDTGEIKPSFFETSKELQKYALQRPKEWEIVSRTLGIPRQNSRHASAFIIADDELHNIVPMMEVNGVRKVTQWEAKEVEGAGLIKYDFLCITNLIDLEKAIAAINKRNGHNDLEPGWFYHNGVKTFIWDLPKDDEKVAAMLASGDTETLFQENTKSMYPFVTQIKPKSIMDHATILALCRPGPMDFINESTGLSMAQEYIERRQGRGTYDLPELVELLPETYGVIVFQEQITKVAKILGGFSGEKAEIFRENMCKKKLKELMSMKPDFMAGAQAKGMKLETAEIIWNQMETFGQYGFSIIHSVGYAMITYATGFLKAHYPLEWWSAVLSNSDAKEINEKLWKHVRHLVAPPDINLSGAEMIIDYDTGKIRSKLTMVKGLSKAGVEKLVQGRPYTSIQDFARRADVGASMARKLMAVGVMDSLFKNGENLVDKLQAYADELEKISYEEKLKEYPAKLDAFNEKKARGERATRPPEPKLKRGKVDEDYLSMGPLDLYSLQKSILPSMPISLTDLVIDLGMVTRSGRNTGMVPHPEWDNKMLHLMDGDQIAMVEPRAFDKFTIVACAGYVVEAKEFTFKKDATKKGLRIVIDTDNYLREMVMWPDYDTGKLQYPEGLAPGAVGVFYLSKRAGKTDAAVNAVKLLKKGETPQKKTKAATT